MLALSVPGMLLTQRLGSFDQHAVLLGYKAFSILLGTALIAATWTVNARRAERDRLAPRDLAMLAAIGLVGGPITALFSVGVGELVALYLFIRHYPVLLCTGAACVISAISVIAGSVWHIEAGTIAWEVVLLAAPAAMLGGFLARPIALWLGARRVSRFRVAGRRRRSNRPGNSQAIGTARAVDTLESVPPDPRSGAEPPKG